MNVLHSYYDGTISTCLQYRLRLVEGSAQSSLSSSERELGVLCAGRGLAARCTTATQQLSDVLISLHAGNQQSLSQKCDDAEVLYRCCFLIVHDGTMLVH